MAEVTHCPQAQLHIERCACPAHRHQDPTRSAKDQNRNGNNHGHCHASAECAVPGQCKSFHQLHTMMLGVARKMKILRYDFVTIDAESSGGVLSVWKTTQ
jgi:hypothetical protein